MNSKNNYDSLEFNVLIHTLQGASSDPALPEEEIRRKPYIKGVHFTKGKAVYQINPNKYGFDTVNLSEQKYVIVLILSELGISNFELRRVDVAINTRTPFNELYKINNYFKELFAVSIYESNSYYTNGNDFRKRSLKVSNRNCELEIYDKQLESKGLDPAKTRIEFRFKRLKKNESSIDEVVRKTLNIINDLPKYIEELNKNKTKQLYNQLRKENSIDYEGRITKLTTFVSKYADFIFNMDILKGLHVKCCVGKCKNWLYRYRKSGKTLTLYSKKDLSNYINIIKQALDDYIKGNTDPSLLYPNNEYQKAS